MRDTKGVTKNLTINLRKYVIRYLLIALTMVVTPWAVQPIAKLFDWVALAWSDEGLLRPFFVEIFTAFFWLLEWASFLFVDGYFKKRAALNTANQSQENIQTETSEIIEEVATADGERAKDGEKAKKKKIEPLFPKTPLLPMKNVMILFVITAACILLITLQIGLKVKPFYELGDKTNYVKMFIKGGEILRNLIKCIWVMCILETSLRMAEEIMLFARNKNADLEEKRENLLKWLIVCALTVLFGILDVIFFANSFAWTYIVFYAAFTAVYFFTNQSPVKSYLLICFIYIF